MPVTYGTSAIWLRNRNQSNDFTVFDINGAGSCPLMQTKHPYSRRRGYTLRVFSDTRYGGAAAAAIF